METETQAGAGAETGARSGAALAHVEPATDDAIGHLLLRCLSAGAEPGAVFEVIERSDGFVGVCDAAEYFAPFEDWPTRERSLISRARGAVLDIGCGAGRHALHLRERGLDVTAVDSSPGAVRVCRERGVPARPGTAGELPCPDGSYDTLLALGANLGLLGGRARAAELLAEFARVAAPGARLLATGRDPYASTGRVHTDYHEANRRAGRMAGQLRIRIRSGAVAGSWFDYLYCSLPELEELLAPSDWTPVEAFEDPGGGYGVVLALRR
ncbi:class I SAM-dependent methyltransferase [Streptomyces sp. NPDC048606]|uniref:class I SAM-dependent methyltransferase n=1 Tax=Streptomyces sp. NPDC048606 TaxID=3154726 RepID=UPI0034454C41